MIRFRSRRTIGRALVLVALTLVFVTSIGTPSEAAVTSLTLSTPYPTIETQAGATVKMALTVESPTIQSVELALDGIPDGWRSTLRGGGFVVHAVTATPEAPAAVDLEVALPTDVGPGEYPIVVSGVGAGGGTSSVRLVLDVVEQLDAGVKVTADFPSLTGDPASAFTYNLTITNDTPEDQTFTFEPAGPQGWTVEASPSAQANARTVTIEAGSTAGVKVVANAPESVTEGSYPIEVRVTAANGATGSIELSANVTGTPKLSLATADQRLDVSGRSNSELRIPLIVANTGTGALESVHLASTAPSGWDVSFEPTETGRIDGGDTTQVTAVVKPAAEAVAGDYALTIRSSSGGQSSNLDLRYNLTGSRLLGLVALGVIAAAFAGLAGVFVKFGRR
jgi:uncharacterized membrane protein